MKTIYVIGDRCDRTGTVTTTESIQKWFWFTFLTYNMKLTLEEAKAICNGMNQQRIEKMRTNKHEHQIDDSLRYQEDFVLSPTIHADEAIDQGT